MFKSLARVTAFNRVHGFIAVLCAATVVLSLPGLSHADAKSEARSTIAKIKSDIVTAKKQINDLENKIIAADIAIAVAEAAVRKAQNDGDTGLGLQIVVIGLKSGRADLVKSKNDWQRNLDENEKVLKEWESELRRLGG